MTSVRLLWTCLSLCICFAIFPTGGNAAEVVAFWGFAEDYNFDSNPNKQDFAADVDNTVTGNANLQAFLGNADELDDNGGGGFLPYTSPTSGVVYGITRTIKWDDLKGSGDDFDIGGVSEFLVDKNDGNPAALDDFSNDALMYITLDGSDFADFEIRFDVEGTPGDLPDSFDIFYRVGGTGQWNRDADQNNLMLAFREYDPVDPENQFASSNSIALSSVLNGQSQIELIINDFAENGNGEMEIDNIEIIASRIPEPSALVVVLIGMAAGLYSPRSRCLPAHGKTSGDCS